MDHGLGFGVTGSELVSIIKDGGISEQKIVFVANTGGTPEKLLEAGCLQNFGKGRCPEGVLQALAMCT